jgi:DNA-binding transcriptional MocR family regulator
VKRQKEEIRLRQAIVREILGTFDLQTHENSPQAWLHLPEPWRGNSFARITRQKGVGVLAAEAFTVGRETAPHAIRINVGAARSRGDLRQALEILAELVTSGRPQLHDVV